MDEIIKTIKEVTKQILDRAGFESTVFVREEEGTFFVEIKQDEPGLLIGQGGKNLLALQHILKIVVFKKTGQVIPLILDAENYRKKQQEQLHQEALKAAEKVIENKRTFVFRPMSSFERRIVHLALADNKDIITESIGIEPNRRVVVRIKQ